MIESVDLSIWFHDGNQTEIELSPMQTLMVLKILGIQPAGETYIKCYYIKCYSDQTLQKFLDMPTNPLRLKEKDHD